MIHLVLASGSPRRRQLLETLGAEFEVRPADVDESSRPGEHPHELVERLARAKASLQVAPGEVVLGADTVVVHEGHVLGKPAHPAEAHTMLRHLSGAVHHVATGVAVAVIEDGKVAVEALVVTALVRMALITDDEISAYVATGEPLDKAGAYAIQEKGGLFVEAIEGHPTTVVGLPLPDTRRLLARRGVHVLG